MRSNFVAAAAACAMLAACNWKAGQANSAQGNISQDNRPPATAQESTVTNNAAASNEMAMLAVPAVKGAEAARIMHERHEGMEAIGDATKAINRTLKGTPDLSVVRANAAKIAQLSKQASGWFPAGTGPDVGKTGAKPEIWQSPEDFASKLRSFQAAADQFNAAARGNDIAAINAKFAALGQSCKACHDKYRAEMKH
ncbi:MAG: c-type cytochrome [Bacillota bacterium]